MTPAKLPEQELDGDEDLAGRHWSPDDLRALRGMMANYSRPFEEPPRRKSLVDFTINAQALILLVICGLGGATGWTVNAFVGYQSFKSDYDTLKSAVSSGMQQTIKDNQALTDQLNIIRQGSLQIREQLSEMQKQSAARDLEQDRTIAELQTEIAVMKARVDELRPQGQKGELDPMPPLTEEAARRSSP